MAIAEQAPFSAPMATMTLRRQVLRVLQEQGQPLAVQTISDYLGRHPNSIRFHLTALVEAGKVATRREERTTPGRPRLMYEAVASTPEMMLQHYQALARMLVHTVETAAGSAEVAPHVAQAAGRSWVEQLPADSGAVLDGEPSNPEHAGLDQVVRGLAQVGFATAVGEAESGEVELSGYRCPFGLLSEDSGSLVCSLHAGLIEGWLERAQADYSLEELEPFVQPDLCVARLSAVGTGTT